MVKLLFVTLLSIQTAGGVVASSTAPNPARPEMALDFLLGRWRTVGGVPNPDGGYTRDAGLMIGERAFDGGTTPSVLVRTVQDGSESGDDPFGLDYFESLYLYAYHATSKTWRGVSHNTLGDRKWRDVTIGDGTMSFIQTGELFREATGEVRFHYYAITADHFEVRVDHRANPSSKWTEGTYRMTADRIEEK